MDMFFGHEHLSAMERCIKKLVADLFTDEVADRISCLVSMQRFRELEIDI